MEINHSKIKTNFILLLAFFLFLKSNSQVDTRVSASSDDAEERLSDGDVLLNSSDLEFLTDVPAAHDKQSWVGIRFDEVDIPKGASIISAYIEFTVDESVFVTDTDLIIYGENADSSFTFAAIDFDISSRNRTSDSIEWCNLPQWTPVGANFQSPDIAVLVQEVIDRSGWKQNNPISFLITGDGHRTAESYDGSASKSPRLVVDYLYNPLPIVLIDFKASFNNINKQNCSQLDWATATEINNAYFAIERSMNGQDFIQIKTIVGSGNSNKIIHYSYLDCNVPSGDIYYRLKQVDYDHRYSYSKVVAINIRQERDLRVYPNPFSKHIHIQFSGEALASNLSIELLDLPNRKLMSDINWTLSEYGYLTVDLSMLPAGVYLISIKDDSGSYLIKEKLIKS